MPRLKQVSLLLLRLALTFLAVLLSYSLSTLVMGTADISMTAEEEAQAAQGLIRVSLAYAVVFSFLALRARWYGLKFIGGLFLVFFGVETFMAQIETLYFNSAV
jgi:inner membrane protein involved in colicin E2 resistance